MKQKSRLSASLLIGSYQWALARLREVSIDPYAEKIKYDQETPDKAAVPTCLNNGGIIDCKKGPNRQSRCDLCGKTGKL